MTSELNMFLHRNTEMAFTCKI